MNRLTTTPNGNPKARSHYAPGQRLLVSGCLVELLCIVSSYVGSSWGGSGCEIRLEWAAVTIDGGIVAVHELTECRSTSQGFERDEKDAAFANAAAERLKPNVFDVTVRRAYGFDSLHGRYIVSTFTSWRHTMHVADPDKTYRAQERLLRDQWPTKGTAFVLPYVR